MSLNFEEIHFSDLLTTNGVYSSTLENMFGFTLDREWIGSIKINTVYPNFWIWNNHSRKASITSSVYDQLNGVTSFNDWKGWSDI